MKRISLILLAVAILVLLGWLWLAKISSPASLASLEPQPTNQPAALTAAPAPKPPPLVGETILRGYATPASTPENDLTLMSRLMDNFLLLVKSAADRPMSANEDWADALRGKNPAHERFLPDEHIALNAAGQLIDRWQTPLFFHALGGRRFEIRSAGPDKTMWTEDDLHRNADGSFRRGANLKAPSLLDAAGSRSIAQ